MTDLLSFGRRNGEGINQVLTRYEIVGQRARTEGLFVMSTEGCALQLLSACGVATNQMMQLLQPLIPIFQQMSNRAMFFLPPWEGWATLRRTLQEI